MKWILLALVAMVFVALLFRAEPEWDPEQVLGKESVMHRFAGRFRARMDDGDLTPGCFHPDTLRFEARPFCATQVQCSRTSFRYLDLEFAGSPAQIDFQPRANPHPDDQPPPTCDDDGGLSTLSVKLNERTDAAVLVVPRSGGTITVTCLPVGTPQLACAVQAR